jgi:hypothetical protein
MLPKIEERSVVQMKKYDGTRKGPLERQLHRESEVPM